MAASALPSRRPKTGWNGEVTRVFSGVLNAKCRSKSRIGSLTPAFSGAQRTAEWLRNPYMLPGPKEGGMAT